MLLTFMPTHTDTQKNLNTIRFMHCKCLRFFFIHRKLFRNQIKLFHAS